jgi:hypothetical protein
VTDVILIAAIVAFFCLSGLLVKALDHMIEGGRSAADAEPEPDVEDVQLDPGKLA